MPKTLQGLQTNFTSGAISPKLWGHVDINKYKNGVKISENAYVLSHGPIRRRNGTKFINEVKDSSKEVRLLKFQFNQLNAFILEFGEQYIRFYKDQGVVVDGAAITNGTFTTDLSGWTSGDTGTGVSSQTAGVMRLNGGAAGVAIRTQTLPMVSPGQYMMEVIGVTNTSILRIGTTLGGTDIVNNSTVNVGGNSFSFTPNTYGPIYIQFRNANNNNADIDSVTIVGNPVYEIATPYLDSQVNDLTYTQLGKTIYLAQENHAPAQLVWNGTDNDWTYSELFFYPPATTEGGENPLFTLTPGATTGTGVTFTSSGAYFLKGDVGRQIINQSGNGSASIVSYTSTTQVVADILENFDNTTAIPSGSWTVDLSPIAKLNVDQSGVGVSATLTSYYTDSSRGPARTITAITKAAPGVVTSAGHGFAEGDKVEFKNIVGMTQLNNNIWYVKYIDANTFSLKDAASTDVNTTPFSTYASGGTARLVLTDIGLDVFRSSDVGRYVLLNGGVGQITSVTNAQTAVMELQKSLNSVNGTPNWSIEDETWGADTGYPRTVTLHQQRLWWGGTDSESQTIWGSESGLFDSLGVGPGDSDSVQFDISTSEVNQVQWLKGLGGKLVIGTFGAELTVDAGGVAGPITPSAIRQDEVGAQSGSILQQPLVLNNEILYIQRSGQRVNSFKYQFEIDNYVSDDLLFLAEHLPTEADGVKELTYSHDPDRLIYAVCNNGDMLIGTYYRDQQVIAWTKFITDGIYENAQTISVGPKNEVWVVVKRTINGVTKRYLEIFDDSDGTSNLDGYSDCYLTYSTPLIISNITKATQAVVGSIAHGLVNGDHVKLIGVEGMTEVNGRTFVVEVININTFYLKLLNGTYLNSTSYGTWTSGSGSLYKLITTVSGLSHLEGKTVQIKADGAVHPDKVVTSGSITLDREAYELCIGLEYNMLITTLDREVNIGLGSEQGQPQRWVKPILKIYKSALPTLNSEFLPARTPQDLMDHSVALSTGNIEYGSLDWDTISELTLELSKPYPFILLGVYGSMVFGVR